MKCPACGKEMLLGTAEVKALRDRAAVRFYPAEEMEKPGLFYIRSGYSAAHKDGYPALRCTTCKKFFVEFEEGVSL